MGRPKTNTDDGFFVRLTPQQHAAVKTAARRRLIPKSQVVRELVDAHLAQGGVA